MTNTTQAVEQVLKTDVLRRMKTPAARREELLDEFERSGLSGKKFAALVGIKYPTFATWAQRRRRQRGVYTSAKVPIPARDKLLLRQIHLVTPFLDFLAPQLGIGVALLSPPLKTNPMPCLGMIGDVVLSENERLAGDADNALVRAATGRWRQHSRRIGDVRADHGKVAISQLPDVRATVAADSLCPVLVRVRAEPTKKHWLCIHVAQQSGKCRKNARTK